MTPCNYRGADWYIVGKDERGIHLKSVSKHIGNIVVPHAKARLIREGFYVRGSGRR